LALKKIFFGTLKRYVIRLGVEIKKKKVKLWMLCVNGKVDKSRQIRLLTFEENSSRRMGELGSSFFIVIVVLDVS
jgi:hypothetical protein